MAVTVADLLAKLRLDAGDFETKLGGAGRALGGFSGRITAAHAVLAGFAGLITGGVVAALSHLVVSSLKLGESVNESSARLGIQAEALQGLRFAAQQTGADVAELEVGLRFLNRRIGEAATGNLEASNLFRDLGINIRAADGSTRAAADVFADFADKIKNTADPAERTRLAMEAFSRGGAALIPMLAEGKEGIAALRKEAERLGLVLDASTAAQADKAKDSLDKLAAVIKINLARAIIAMSPIIEDLANALSENGETWKRWGENARDWIKSVRQALGQVPLSIRESIERPLDRMRKEMEDFESGGLLSRLFRDPFGIRRGILREGIRALEQEVSGAEPAGDLPPRPAVARPAITPATTAQLEQIGRLRSQVVGATAGLISDEVARSSFEARVKLQEFQKQVDDLAASVPSRAEEIKGLGRAFEAIIESQIRLKESTAAVDKAAAAAGRLGLDASLFAGFKEIEGIQQDAADFTRGIAEMATAGVPLRDLFPAIEEGQRALDERTAALTEKFAAQPAVLDRMKSSLLGIEFGGFARDVDAMVRSMAGAGEGFAKMFAEETGGAVVRQWLPELRTSVLNVNVVTEDFVRKFTDLPGAMLAVHAPMVTVTSDAWSLAQAFAAVAFNAARVLSVVSGTGTLAPVSAPATE